MKTIEERAEYIYPVFHEKGDNAWFPDRNLKSRVAYINGATEQHEIDIDKACEWLKKNYQNMDYINVDGDLFDLRLIDDFRKAMEQ